LSAEYQLCPDFPDMPALTTIVSSCNKWYVSEGSKYDHQK